jgi:hypothetical protein
MTSDVGANASSLELKDDLGQSPEAVARRWKLELKLADKREQEWRKKATAIYKQYTPESPKANSFNILWSNTETLRQSVYNSLPEPDARRRYSDDDELGEKVGEVITRALEFAQDTYDFDAVLKGDVLSMLLAGRAVSRVRYVPDIRTIGGEDSGQDDDTQESDTYEEIEWEQVICERVQWDDFRISAGKIWDEVCWIAFRHRLTREDCIEKFGEQVGKAIPLDSVDDDDVKKSKDNGDLFKTAEVWEIWDKDKKQVHWICPTYPTPCKTQNDPLKLSGFFCVPRPLYAIENDQTLVPTALFSQYEQQALELNRISTRINKLISALKVRGVYDSTLTELSELMKGDDNDLIPAANVTALLDRGGLDKAIWMMPIDTAAMVLKELYAQRDATKQVIYEITGISDIMRSASDPNETYGAQKIKTQWGTQRLQRMQRETQRYIRDLIRLKAEIIAEKFQPETLEAMTLLKYPHQSDVDAQMMQYQQAAMQAQMQGQQPPQPPQTQITWEQVIEAMRSDATRTYRIDIETDSTLSATQDSDMQGMKELLTGLSQIMQGFAPAVQEGAMSVDVLKELMLVVTRRARMGTAVEDVINKIAQPQIKGDPEQAKAQAAAQQQQAQQQHEAQLEQFKSQLQDQQHQRELQAKAQAEQFKAQTTMEVERHKQQMQDAQIQRQNDMEAQRNAQLAELEHAREVQRMQLDAESEARKLEFDRWKTDIEASTKITVAQIAAQSAMDQTLAKAEQSANERVAQEVKPDNSETMNAIAELGGRVEEILKHMQAPRKIVRDANGKAVGVDVGGVVKTINRGADGRMEGV